MVERKFRTEPGLSGAVPELCSMLLLRTIPLVTQGQAACIVYYNRRRKSAQKARVGVPDHEVVPATQLDSFPGFARCFGGSSLEQMAPAWCCHWPSPVLRAYLHDGMRTIFHS